MKKNAFLVTLIFLSFVLISTFGQENGGRHTRIHLLMELDNDTRFEYTWIYDFTTINGNIKNATSIVLIDLGQTLGKAGKWVYLEDVSEPDTKDEKRSVTFKNISTGESLSISYSGGHEGAKEYILECCEKKKKIVIPAKEIGEDQIKFHPFVEENFSKDFLSGLQQLKTIVYKLYNKNTDFEIRPPSFRAICGESEETKNAIKSHFLDPENVRWSLNLHYNCDFDAKFGYPCTEDEKPAKNEKVLVKEKK